MCGSVFKVRGSRVANPECFLCNKDVWMAGLDLLKHWPRKEGKGYREWLG